MLDAGNNILLVPGIDTEPEAVNCILYFSDVAECGGATAFVPHTPELYDIDEGRHVNFLPTNHSRYHLPLRVISDFIALADISDVEVSCGSSHSLGPRSS